MVAARVLPLWFGLSESGRTGGRQLDASGVCSDWSGRRAGIVDYIQMNGASCFTVSGKLIFTGNRMWHDEEEQDGGICGRSGRKVPNPRGAGPRMPGSSVLIVCT